MKNFKSSKDVGLLVDVVEYAFVEWLVRRKVYRAFRANYDRAAGSSKSFRDCLRDHVRYVIESPTLDPSRLISSAFLFDSTSEGYKFWLRHSEAWSRFYSSFSKHI